MITVICQNCGKEFEAFECRKQKYCSSDCWYEYTKKKNFQEKAKSCNMCGKKFLPKNKEQRFCSRKCSDKHQTMLVGEDNPHFKQVGVTCKQCGIVFYDKSSHAKQRKFCSYACFNNYQQEDEQYKIRMSNVLKKEQRGRKDEVWIDYDKTT